MNATSPGLRQRDGPATTRPVQEKALDLLDTRGFESLGPGASAALIDIGVLVTVGAPPDSGVRVRR